MSDNAEEGIARIQAAVAESSGAGGLKKHHAGNIAYLDERIVVFFLAIAIIGLAVLWAGTTSALILYGSLAGVILLIILWGIARFKRLEAIRRERLRQAVSWQSDKQN
jgi:D-alanyl-lipoteichoic acid acyltransferase DltB (MBOAT superfamily)